VSSQSVGDDILVSGRIDMNRALDGGAGGGGRVGACAGGRERAQGAPGSSAPGLGGLLGARSGPARRCRLSTPPTAARPPYHHRCPSPRRNDDAGDIVAVELLPEDQWRAPSRVLPGGGAAAGGGEDASGQDDGEEGSGDGAEGEGGAGLFEVAPGAPPPDDEAAAGGRRPTGRVVGVLKRNWRARGYCGSLKPEEVAGGGAASVLFVPVERRFPMIRWEGLGPF
jgi:hypothetical protein